MQDITRYSKDGHVVVHGDALAVLDNLVDDASVNLIFADPPYNIGKQFSEFHDTWKNDAAYTKWCMQWLNICIRKLRPDGAIYVMTSTQAMPNIDLFLRNKLRILSRIVWHYDSSGVQAKKYFGSLYEPILYAVKDVKNYVFNSDAIMVEAKTGAIRQLIDYRGAEPKPYNNKKVPGNVWDFSRVRYRMDEYEEHPSQKPEALLERIILASSNPGDIVLDPFAGTFTTGAVAKRLGRKSIGIELEKEYIKIGVRRLGIATEIDGEPLDKIRKTTARKNGKAKDSSERYSSSLFSDLVEEN